MYALTFRMALLIEVDVPALLWRQKNIPLFTFNNRNKVPPAVMVRLSDHAPVAESTVHSLCTILN